MTYPIICPSKGISGLKNCDVCAKQIKKICIVCGAEFIRSCQVWFKCPSCFQNHKKVQDPYRRD